jgi:hypothetical protein
MASASCIESRYGECPYISTVGDCRSECSFAGPVPSEKYMKHAAMPPASGIPQKNLAASKPARSFHAYHNRLPPGRDHGKDTAEVQAWHKSFCVNSNISASLRHLPSLICNSRTLNLVKRPLLLRTPLVWSIGDVDIRFGQMLPSTRGSSTQPVAQV